MGHKGIKCAEGGGSMQRMIMIPEDRYNKMLKSYDEVMEELIDLREQLKEAKAGVVIVSKD